MARIGLEKIEKYLFDSANFLRGHIDAGDYKQFIFPLLFFKRVCDVYDEEYAKMKQSLELTLKIYICLMFPKSIIGML